MQKPIFRNANLEGLCRFCHSTPFVSPYFLIVIFCNFIFLVSGAWAESGKVTSDAQKEPAETQGKMHVYFSHIFPPQNCHFLCKSQSIFNFTISDADSVTLSNVIYLYTWLHKRFLDVTLLLYWSAKVINISHIFCKTLKTFENRKKITVSNFFLEPPAKIFYYAWSIVTTKKLSNVIMVSQLNIWIMFDFLKIDLNCS